MNSSVMLIFKIRDETNCKILNWSNFRQIYHQPFLNFNNHTLFIIHKLYHFPFHYSLYLIFQRNLSFMNLLFIILLSRNFNNHN